MLYDYTFTNFFVAFFRKSEYNKVVTIFIPEEIMNFSVRLKQLRQKHKLTQGELADILGLKPTAISNYESMRNEPSFEKLIALSKYFDVSCDYLLGMTDAYFPIGGEVLDKDIVELFNTYQQLNEENAKEVSKFLNYLLYKQEHENTIDKKIKK